MAQSYDATEIPEGLRAAKNSTGSDIAANRFVTGHYGAATLPAAITDKVIGATRNDGLKNGAYGSIATRGLVEVTAGVGGVTAGDRVGPEAATGKALTVAPGAGANAAVAGIAHSTAAADALCMVELGMGSMMQGA